MELPLISCIIPVYNAELYVAEAIDSIFAQTYRPLEIIVVDDGSTDGSAAIVAGYGDRVRYTYQPNAGVSAARNTGLSLAVGGYIAFLDADDLWEKDKLARQMDFLQTHPHVDICLTYVQNFWIEELADEAMRLKESPRAQPLPGFCFAALLASRAAFDRVGPVNEALPHAEGPEWLMRAADAGVVVEVLPDVLLRRRYHHTNSTRVDRIRTSDTFLGLLKRHLDRKRLGDSLR